MLPERIDVVFLSSRDGVGTGRGEPLLGRDTGEAKKARAPRVEWAGLPRRTFALDVFACARSGGRRRGLAYLMAPGAVRAIQDHSEMPSRPVQLALAQAPPQLAWY